MGRATLQVGDSTYYFTCLNHCYIGSETSCHVVKLKCTYRDYSFFGDSALQITECDDEYFPPPVEPCWVDEAEVASLWKVFRKGWERFLETSTENKSYTVEHLPATSLIDPGTLAHGRIVSCRRPWDFCMIFDSEIYGQSLGNDEWMDFFGEENQKFYTTFDLFRGITMLLSMFLQFLKTDQLKTLKISDYLPGELVIAAIPRPSKEYRSLVFAYRGVILSRVNVITETKDEKSFIVYLLDTGEQHLVSLHYLRPLPPPFVGFAPLAVRCALHGVSPIGEKWNKFACKVMREAVFPGPFSSKKPFAEFYSTKEKNVQSEDSRLHRFVYEEPYFVELTIKNTLDTFVNVSSFLIQKKVALEWTLCPQRPALRHEENLAATSNPTLTNVGIKKRFPAVTRDEALLCTESSSQPVQTIPAEQTKNEMKRVVCLQKRLFKMSYMENMTNIMQMRLQDPVQVPYKPSIPPIFTENENEKKKD